MTPILLRLRIHWSAQAQALITGICIFLAQGTRTADPTVAKEDAGGT